MSIACKEAHESAYWIRLIQEAQLLAATRVHDLSDETRQLIKILSAILVNAKRGAKN